MNLENFILLSLNQSKTVFTSIESKTSFTLGFTSSFKVFSSFLFYSIKANNFLSGRSKFILKDSLNKSIPTKGLNSIINLETSTG